ncbi:Pentatricopeptide repeat-containing protein [Dendrobium catenatum]|uniref:Pentatricopeptide repeat-containing protein n=1 Tax=Dendrobium catenatum TaxID=906689 RepID=A0A2I0VB69_9ASPA|nr:Pentatricopeptide repeat-containing protein [Dendrobium catenatum]
MAWCGENICLGIGKEYIILNSTTGATSKVFSSGRSIPLVVPLPSGELILGKDDVGVFVDQNGKLLQDGRICWSEAPSSIVIHKPYGLARLPRHVEIRSLYAPYPLVQTIVLRDVHLLQQSNNCAIAAVGSSIYGLLHVPVGAQIVQLTASGNFVGALALCKLLPPEDSSLRAAKEASIHIRYGHYLFDNGSYEESMDQFLASQVDITYVLSLYPSITLPKDLTIVEPEKFQEQTGALSREGSLQDAKHLHGRMAIIGISPNICIFNSLINGYCRFGLLEEGVKLFKDLAGCSLEPDGLCLSSLIYGYCTKVEEGNHYLNSMRSVHGIEPGPDHYTCMVDLFGRADLLQEALNLINSIPDGPHSETWGALLSATVSI